MKKQVLRFKSGESMVISTLEGPVRITRVDSRSLEFELPPGVHISKTEEKARPVQQRFRIGGSNEQPARTSRDESVAGS